MATVLIIFLRIKWPNLVLFKQWKQIRQKWLLSELASTMMWPKSMQFIVAFIAKILAGDNENWRNFKTNVFQKKTKPQQFLLSLLFLCLRRHVGYGVGLLIWSAKEYFQNCRNKIMFKIQISRRVYWSLNCLNLWYILYTKNYFCEIMRPPRVQRPRFRWTTWTIVHPALDRDTWHQVVSTATLC